MMGLRIDTLFQLMITLVPLTPWQVYKDQLRITKESERKIEIEV